MISPPPELCMQNTSAYSDNKCSKRTGTKDGADRLPIGAVRSINCQM
jgi:hypothetical protein